MITATGKLISTLLFTKKQGTGGGGGGGGGSGWRDIN